MRLSAQGLILLLLTAAPLTTMSAQLRGYNPTNSADDTAKSVSLIQLIANPRAWDGKKVRLIGFLRLEFEGDALYLHKEDFEHSISNNAVWIDRPRDLTSAQEKAMNTQYVICEGTFRATDKGHMDMFSGTISGINRLEAWDFDRSKK
ncbi:hypothetical protein [Edaphobacter aggregans]|uniref:hypothetical protein n=1 Tax=Edaphobacter aggregans TaxID=570835 RepID=UPI00068A8088|nr:hypothetical protein [Edaphobacter aggregans]